MPIVANRVSSVHAAKPSRTSSGIFIAVLIVGIVEMGHWGTRRRSCRQGDPGLCSCRPSHPCGALRARCSSCSSFDTEICSERGGGYAMDRLAEIIAVAKRSRVAQKALEYVASSDLCARCAKLSAPGNPNLWRYIAVEDIEEPLMIRTKI